ncbi:MAG: Asp-tRNA(Asn)/Glu-tRNA(Gln) amidotransferase subunit GatB [bacterium]|nr:Asp-tRNA(Asn)/Glu-tRNA(Gln) amidotransferase subunit GatB [bacterium]
MTTYIPVIGLEIHAELKTRTKMFCGCLNDPDEKVPNKNVCPICTGQPGTLPVANKAAIESLIKVGMAISGEIPAISKFDRKNYFYPDIPKGYQISQYDVPLVSGGLLKGVKITRVHLEEDTGRLIHGSAPTTYNLSARGGSSFGGQPTTSSTLVDYNRAGIPLMELVTEPDIRSAEQVGEFATELQLLLRYLGVSDADMEKGQMRVEVNLSLGTIVDGELKFGTKVEVKNINSFKAAVAAAKYEIERQGKALEAGEKIVQETRGWDDVKKATVSQRKKESSHDYRYFPEPDIPPLDLAHFDLKRIKSEIPELPQAKRVRFTKEYGLNASQIDVLVNDRLFADYFENVFSELKEHGQGSDVSSQMSEKLIQLAVNYLTSDLRSLMTASGLIDPMQIKIEEEDFADLIILIAEEKVSSRGAKDILAKMFETGGDPMEIMKTEGHAQVSDKGAFAEMATDIIAANPGPVSDYKKGKEAALMFFVGQGMKKAKEMKLGANPNVLKEVFKELLSR